MSSLQAAEEAPGSEPTGIGTGGFAPLAGPGARTAAGRVLGAVGYVARRPGLLLASLIVLVVLLWAIVPGVWTSYSPLATSISSTLKSPSGAHLFGTDQLGRDVFARTVYGTRLSLEAAFTAVLIGLVIGSVIGLFAGYNGGIVDTLLMRVIDVCLSVPTLLLAMAIVTAIGFGSVPLAIGVGIGMIGSVARVMRSEVLRVRESMFVDAERSMGAKTTYILFRHILPSAAGPVLVLAILDLSTAILALAALSFLGFGAPPPAPEWGSLIASGQAYLSAAWWMSTLPGLTIAIFAISINRIARELQEKRPA
jgi:peptide/nickel transport system permease protein